MPDDAEPRIMPCLWFDGAALEAAEFYAATFPDSRVLEVHRAPADYPGGTAGAVLTVGFTLLGMRCLGLNGGPYATFNEAVSFQVFTEDQAETDRYWHAIVDNGGSASQCSWCKDRYGFLWQIVPRALMRGMQSPDPAVAARVMRAMMTMSKIDIAAIEAAARGEDHR